MTPEEIKAAKRIVLAGILLKDGSQFDTRTNFQSCDTTEHNEWVEKVHDSARKAGLFNLIKMQGCTVWNVTEKGLKFLAED